jgi:hypothetical protein
MKKFIPFFIAALCIIASCSKDSGFGPGSGLSPGLCKGYPAWVQVIVVPPDQDGDGDDTDDLLAAFAAAKPGSVIKLLEGVYHVGYMEISDFNGSLIGAGKDKTILYPKTPLDAKSQLVDRNLFHCWWRVIGGNILISNLTFNTTVPEPIQNYNEDTYYGKDLFAMIIFNDYNVNSPVDNTYQKVLIKDVNFIGGYDDAYAAPGSFQFGTDHNTIEGIWVGLDYNLPLESVRYTLTKGEYKAENCYFEHILDGVEGFGLGKKAAMSVSSCRFNNCWIQAYFTANFNSRVSLTNNIFSGSTVSDVFIEDTDWGVVYGYAIIEPVKRTQYTLTGNIFNATPSTLSVVFWDDWVAQNQDDILPMQLKVYGNIFNLTEGSTGITAINSQDAIINNNRFKGICLTGIMVDGIPADRFGTPLQNPDKAYADNALLLGNNFSGLESTQADIVLGERSKNCTVVGSGKDEIINNGTGNKVIGLKPVHKGYHFGPTIRDNFMMWHRFGHH